MADLIDARLKQLAPGVYRIICGAQRERGPCPAQLGLAVHHDVHEDPEWLPRHGSVGPDDWYVDDGIFRLHDDGTHTKCEPKRRSRRPLPVRLVKQNIPDHPDPEHAHSHAIVGNLPILPATIRCPVCGALNRVARPEMRPIRVGDGEFTVYTL